MKTKMKGKYRKGVFLVVYRKEKEKVFYLILRRKLHWKGWEFPKGGIEKGESLIKAVKRELKEETGLKARKIFDMKVKGKFNYKKKLEDRHGIKGMVFSLFAVEVFPGKIRLDRKEHSAYKWLEYEKARKLLTWQNQRRCLKLVDKVLI